MRTVGEPPYFRHPPTARSPVATQSLYGDSDSGSGSGSDSDSDSDSASDSASDGEQ